MSSLNSQRHLDGSMSQHGSAVHHQSGSHGLHGHSQGGTDNASRVYSADALDAHANAMAQNRTIVSYLNDKITTFMMSGADAEMKNMKIEGDLITSFFDSVDKVHDRTLFAFIEDMKHDKELIIQILFN